ncbi:MAG: dTDP-4-dehydrorhamnose 3,5-epimerase [Rhodobiaceae bacterium]|nr:MAG: dTDP-4-dehydrorhamnose 3,5-epimerase [Rhodobiaceae bacterium]
MIDIRATPIEDVKIITPKRFSDDRGYFVETYNAARLAEHGISTHFIQDNQSLSREVGTVRGLHFQTPPFAQAKLVRVVAGAILDIAVDIREASSTYGQYVAVELSADDGRQLFIPTGFAHGFCTLAPDTVLTYKVDAHYSAAHDAGIIWDDGDIGIAWPAVANTDYLSPKDKVLPKLESIDNPF